MSCILAALGKILPYQFFEVILIDPVHEAIRRNPDGRWITKPVHKHREMLVTSAGRRSHGFEKGHELHHCMLFVLALRLGEGAGHSISTITTDTVEVMFVIVLHNK